MAGWKDGCKVFLPTILAFSDGLEPNEKMITYLHSWVLPQKGFQLRTRQFKRQSFS